MPKYKSELRRQHDTERQARDFAVLQCSAKKADAEAFRAWCRARGQSVHAALLAYVRQCIEENGNSGQ